MKNYLLLIIAFTAFSWQSTAQNGDIGKGRFFTTEGTTVKFENLSMGESEHQYQASLGSKSLSIPTNKIVRIERQTGSEAGKWALWMGLSGLVGSALGVVQAHTQNEANGLEVSHKADAPIIIGLTAVSAGIGAAIGSGKKTYETVYTNPQYGSNSSQWQINLLAYGQGGGLAFKLNF